MDITDALLAAFEDAKVRGWTTVSTNASPEAIATAVSRIGTPLCSRDQAPGIEKLAPLRRTEARNRSLSARYGLGEFPFHSDAAHWPSPPLWVVMWCESNEDGRTTRLLPWQAIAPLACRDSAANFLVKNGRKSFYVDVRDTARLDAGCMLPQNAAAQLLLDATNNHELKEIESVVWRPGVVVVLDNQVILHARGTGLSAEVPDRRVLWRALLHEVTV